ncbi:MAG: hypothetical protein HZA90_22695 [Verrucomicrobia bacterium]|nr:hypothetical protein [Verrucomicrobiota bacterium]
MTCRNGGFSILLSLSMAATAWAAEPALNWDTFSDTWVATDALGRSLPTHEQTGPARDNRTVGIFYFLWLGTHGKTLYDNTTILRANPTDPQYGPKGAFHFWGEPAFGYYLSDDEAVMRKHVQMLADAGIDVLIFDVTNGFTYDEVFLKLCGVLAAMRRDGMRTPQISFIAHSSEGQVARRLYDKFYSKGLHSDLWFRWKGKPLILAKPDALTPELRAFFTVRESWAWTKGHQWFADGKDKWPWLDNHPQTFGWHESAQKPEHISVNVAQHPVSNIGRSFHDGKQPPPGQTTTESGLCFDEQWRQALKVDPEFVFLTGWNEWVAQRFISDKGGQTFLGKPLPPGGTFFVDQYNQEFSRDVEPMKGGHGDNYLYQMIANVRRYKGTRSLPPVTPRPITIDGRFDDWKEAGPEFRDTIGDPMRRDNPGWTGGGPYVNRSGRNDIVAAKVSHDSRNLLFYVRTREPLTSCDGTNWMLLFLNTDSNPTNGWLGYDFVVNRSSVSARGTTLEKHQGDGYRWGQPVSIGCRLVGNELELAIPRAALGLSEAAATVDFKWADNILQTGDWSDFMLSGDAAPNDRFNYRARLASP